MKLSTETILVEISTLKSLILVRQLFSLIFIGQLNFEFKFQPMKHCGNFSCASVMN